MNIFEQIIYDQEQRKREPSAKMPKNEAKALLLEGITTCDLELVSLAVKNGARVRGAVNGQDLFAVCLNHFNLPIFQLLFPDKKTKAHKDLMVLIMEGDVHCLEYFSDHLVHNLDCLNYLFRWHLDNNTNNNFANWLNDHFTALIANEKNHSRFRNTPNSLSSTLGSVLKFAARMGHTDLTVQVAQWVSAEQITAKDTIEFDVFNCSLENVADIAKTIDALPNNEKNTVYNFFDLQSYSLGGDLWMDNALQRNPKHVETVLKSPVGCQYVEQRLTQSNAAEEFLNKSIINYTTPNTVQWQNVLRLKNVYQNWISSKNLNIVQHLIGYINHPIHSQNDTERPDSDKLVEVLLRINPEAFHCEFPDDHRLKGSTPFSALNNAHQAQVSKFTLQQNIGKPQSRKTNEGKRKI